MIVCGDFGLCWNNNKTFDYNCDIFSKKDYTILWVQGNHENYDMIEEFPLEEWHGGKVRHIVRDKVILLERGQVFDTNVLTDYFDMLEDKLEYKHWYFGHYHRDLNVDEKHTLLYHGMILLDAKSNLEETPVPGHPRYRHGDIVRMKWSDIEKIGKISIVDAYGTFEQSDEPSYDILVVEENCLYKHILESEILGKVASEETLFTE